MNTLFKVALLIFCSSISWANAENLVFKQNNFQYTPTKSTDELLDRYSQSHAKPQEYWQLTDDEWARYEDIKAKSPWAVWENRATPLAILFHYSDSMEDKRRYARIEAELDTWRQYTVVEFQTLYDRERAIVHARYVDAIKGSLPTITNIRPLDSLRLFVSTGLCEARCRSVVNQAMSVGAKLDIYLIDAKDNEEIFDWAKSAAIPIERVKTKEITLNHENGLLKVVMDQIGLPLPPLPVLFKQDQNGQLAIVAI